MGEGIEWILTERGLSAREAKLYLYLAKNGPKKAIEISRNLKMHKVEVYRFLKNLENKGFAESTLERPRYFEATPFAQVLNLLISERKKTCAALESRKHELLSQFNSIQTEKTLGTTEKFASLSGRENVHLRIFHLLQHARSEVVATTTNLELRRADQSGTLSVAVADLAKRNRNIHARLLTQLNRENLEAVRNLSRVLVNRGLNVDVRQMSPHAKFAPRVVIRDGEEAVAFLTPSEASVAGREEAGLWTNCKIVVYALQALFEELWRDSKALPENIEELQTR